MPIKTEVEILDGGVAVVHCSGRITLGEPAAALREVLNSLLQSKHCAIVFDIPDVPYIDSSGFGELVRAFGEAANAGGGLVLARANQRIKDVLRHPRLSTVFRTFDTVEAAVQFLNKSLNSVTGT